MAAFGFEIVYSFAMPEVADHRGGLVGQYPLGGELRRIFLAEPLDERVDTAGRPSGNPFTGSYGQRQASS
jgi:hypothetical protein